MTTVPNIAQHADMAVFSTRVSGDTLNRMEITGSGRIKRGQGTLKADYKTELIVNFVTAPLTLTDALQADGFIAADTSYRQKVDLAGMNQVRLTAAIKTVSASANTPLLQLRYSAAETVTVASYLIMGATSVQISMFTGTVNTIQDSGWINLVAGAQIDNCWLGLMNIGGDGAADPVVNMVTAHFR